MPHTRFCPCQQSCTLGQTSHRPLSLPFSIYGSRTPISNKQALRINGHVPGAIVSAEGNSAVRRPILQHALARFTNVAPVVSKAVAVHTLTPSTVAPVDYLSIDCSARAEVFIYIAPHSSLPSSSPASVFMLFIHHGAVSTENSWTSVGYSCSMAVAERHLVYVLPSSAHNSTASAQPMGELASGSSLALLPLDKQTATILVFYLHGGDNATAVIPPQAVVSPSHTSGES